MACNNTYTTSDALTVQQTVCGLRHPTINIVPSAITYSLGYNPPSEQIAEVARLDVARAVQEQMQSNQVAGADPVQGTFEEQTVQLQEFAATHTSDPLLTSVLAGFLILPALGELISQVWGDD